jgi:hypothetical protein
MKTKPLPKREVAVLWEGKEVRYIGFQASSDAVNDFEDFGTICEEADYLVLRVDGRYDFDEVLEYIREYNNDA